MPRLSALLERVAEVLERASVLDGPAELGSRLAGRLPHGAVRDVLSGTPLGHPLHPVLVSVPIGAFVGATFLDLTGGDEEASRRLVGLGLAAAVPTALTGLSDWADTEGAEQRVGVAHAIGNSAGLGLLAGSWLARRSGRGGRALGMAGLGMIGLSGWLGGHLTYAQGVGVDTTAFQRPPSEWADACAESDLAEDVPYAVTVEDVPVVLVRHGDALRALGNRCTHRGGPLSDGPVVDGCIECPWHASRFDLTDGAVVRGPASRPQMTFESRVVDGRVQVRRSEVRTLRLNPTS